MRNKKHIPFEVIEKAVAGEPKAIDAVLRHYNGYIKYLSTYQGHINDDIQDRLKAQLIKAILQFRFDRQGVAEPEKAVKDKMHACTSLTAFPVFAVGRLRERNRINRLRSQSIMECYAVEVDFPLIYAVCKVHSQGNKGFILIPSNGGSTA